MTVGPDGESAGECFVEHRDTLDREFDRIYGAMQTRPESRGK